MKNFTLISTIVFSLQFVNAQAAGGGYQCLDFNTSTEVNLGLVPDDNACAIVTAAKNKYFPDITLLNDSENPLPPPIPFPGFPLCFTGHFNGSIGNISVAVTTNSALTENYMDEYNLSHELADLTAATVFTINLPPRSNGNPGRELGTIYTQDVFLDPPPPFVNPAFNSDTREYLTVVGGSKLYEQAKGHLVIEGDAAALGTQLKGKLCILGSLDN